MRRYSISFVLLAVFSSLGAQYRTANFVVNAPTAQIAQQIGQYAEHYRKEKALLWLGQEMPQWPQPCPLHVSVTMDGPQGATSFTFGPGGVQSMKMEIQGPLDRLLASVLPHEVTHTVFAHYFKRPVPRWADEGGSVLSEDDTERDRHDKLTRNILNAGRQIPMRKLFALKEYPRDVVCLYAEGFSMCDYLVKRSDRRTLLAFIQHALQSNYDWDKAVQTYYGHRNVEELEEAWLKNLRDTKNNSGKMPDMVASNQGKAPGTPAGRNVVRLTVPPVQPLDPSPVIRGAMPEQGIPVPQPGSPQFGNPQIGGPQAVWVPVYPQPQTNLPPATPPLSTPVIPVMAPSQVQLGPPQFTPAPSNPVGFPRQ